MKEEKEDESLTQDDVNKVLRNISSMDILTEMAFLNYMDTTLTKHELKAQELLEQYIKILGGENDNFRKEK